MLDLFAKPVTQSARVETPSPLADLQLNSVESPRNVVEHHLSTGIMKAVAEVVIDLSTKRFIDASTKFEEDKLYNTGLSIWDRLTFKERTLIDPESQRYAAHEDIFRSLPTYRQTDVIAAVRTLEMAGLLVDVAEIGTSSIKSQGLRIATKFLQPALDFLGSQGAVTDRTT